MQASNAPSKSPVPFAESGSKNTIPVASQIGVTPGLASFTDGFPPLTMTPLVAGGIPPKGMDFNGILYFLSAAVRWQQAGGSYSFDSAFATAIGGYPKGAMLLKADQSGYWVNTADNNTSNPDAGGASWKDPFSAALIAHGQCRLTVANSTSLRLSPYNGSGLIINGVQTQVPAAGVTVTNAGLTANTLYFVYAYLNGSSAMALELSSVGHSTATSGIEVKAGDLSRSLVGMIYTNASSQFVDSVTQRHCLNWFNRRSLNCYIFSGSSFNFTTSVGAEISTTLRASFLSWPDEATAASITGYASVSTGNIANIQVSVDGSNSLVGGSFSIFPPSGGGQGGYSSVANLTLSEGLHTSQIWGAVAGGATGTIQNTVNTVVVRG
ncbi:hypothetical protein ACOTJG_13440 [Achromobacter xylosoxidans]